jgi:acyl-CoA synthetase (AMP-forming)/AMP-acid ligase II
MERVDASLAWPLRHAARIHADRVAVIDGARRLTYGELDGRVRRLGGALAALGLPRGAFVGVLAGNSAAHLECWLAIPAFGRVIISLNHRLAPGELAFMIDDSQTRALVVDDARLEVGRELRGRCPALKTLIHAGAGPCPEDCVAFASLFDGEPAEPPELPADSLATISYTGGTTGLPKGVMLSHANLVANAKHFLITLGLRPEDRYLHAGPLFHVADSSMVACVTWAGGTHVMLERFDIAGAVRAIAEHGVTVAVLVPTMIRMLLDQLDADPAADLSSLRLVHYAAAPIEPALLRRAQDTLACEFVQGYGMTEAAPGVTYLSADWHRRGERLDSAGHAIPGVQVAVDAVAGEVGEVCVRGPNVMLGYWNRPETTSEVLSPDGWYRTGDLGRLEDGFLYLVDRAKDMIISGGENVYSIEVEHALGSHPAVREAAVIGVPDERWGERVHAIVVLEDGATVTGKELVEHCRGRIGGFKLPRSLELRAEPLPKSGAGKVLKAQLRAGRAG